MPENLKTGRSKIITKAATGLTINLGNYESLRIDAGIETDRILTKEERIEAKKQVKSLLKLTDDVLSSAVEEIVTQVELDKNSKFRISIARSKKQ